MVEQPLEARETIMGEKCDLLRQMESDLALDRPFIKGVTNQIKNCWHFSTDGNSVDRMFDDSLDFKSGMNRIFVVLRNYDVIILAFTLMDTHLHFVLYGALDQCNGFMHDYLKRTSRYISVRHGERKKLANLPVHYQVVDNEYYLKTVICYVIKNAPVGGIPYNGWDYPWSSGPLYFRCNDCWTSPKWEVEMLKENVKKLSGMRVKERISFLNSNEDFFEEDAVLIDGMVFPGEYVNYRAVERLYKTHRSFCYFMSITKEEDVDSRDGLLSMLTIPIQELRQHRKELCVKIYGTESVRSLNVSQRLKLAKILKSKFNCSSKHIARACGLMYEEVKGLLK